MHVPEFEYYRPTTVDEACQLLADLGPGAAALGGGTEVLVEMKNGDRRYEHLVALSGIADLRTIETDAGGLLLGAMVTPGMLARSTLVAESFPEVAEVTRDFAARQVGNRATLGGNIAAAVPSADFPPLLVALHGHCLVASPGGRREVPLEAMFAGPRVSQLRPGELITGIHLPAKTTGTGAKYLKFGLRATSVCAVAGVAAAVTVEGGICTGARIVLGAVAPVPLLATRASESLVGGPIDAESMARAAAIARDECAPISDIRGSAGFRRDLVETLTGRALGSALERALAHQQPT